MTEETQKPENIPYFDDYGGSKEATKQFLEVIRKTADTLQEYANTVETDCATTGVYLDLVSKHSLTTLTSALFAGLQYIQERNVSRIAFVEEMEKQKRESPRQ